MCIYTLTYNYTTFKEMEEKICCESIVHHATIYNNVVKDFDYNQTKNS